MFRLERSQWRAVALSVLLVLSVLVVPIPFDTHEGLASAQEGGYEIIVSNDNIEKYDSSDGSLIDSTTNPPSGKLAIPADKDYYLAAGSNLGAYDKSDDSLVWSISPNNGGVDGFTISQEFIVINTGSSIEVYNREDRTLAFEDYLSSDYNLKSPTIGNGYVAIAEANPRNTHVYDLKTGEKVWANSNGHSNQIFATLIHQGSVYSTDNNGNFVVRDVTDGSVEQQASANQYGADELVAYEDKIIVSVKPSDTGIKMVSADDVTNQIWSKDYGRNGDIAISDDGYIYQIEYYTGSRIRKIDPTDGSQVWTQSVSGNWIAAPLTPKRSGVSAPLAGTVEDQNGNPVSGASVEAYGVPTENLPDGKTAEDILSDISNAQPPNFQEAKDFQSYTESADATYPLAHTSEDWGGTAWTNDIDLADPVTVHKAGEPLVLSAWDPEAAGFFGDTFDAVQRQWPGAPVGNTEVTLTKIDASGASIGSAQTYEIDEPSGSIGGGIDNQPTVTTDSLETGFYLLEAESSGVSHPIAVTPDGTLTSLLSTIQNDIQSDLEKVPSNVQEVQDLTEDGTLGRYTTTSDGNGEFELNIDTGVEMVALQAVKAETPVDLDSETDFVTQTYNQIDSKEDFNYGVAFTTSPTRASVPGRVTLETRRISTRQLKQCDPEKFGEEVCSISDNIPFGDEIEETITEAEDALGELADYLLELIADLENADQATIDAYLEDSQFSSLPDNEDIQDLSRKETRDEIRYATQALLVDGPVSNLDPISGELVDTVLELIAAVENQNAVSEYLSNSQFDSVPDRSDLEGLSRSELIAETNAANTALGAASIPNPPTEPSLDPYRERLVNLLRTVDGSDDIRDTYLENSRFDQIPDREQINGTSEAVLLEELNAANPAINSADRIEAPDSPSDPELNNGLLNVEVPIPANVDPGDIAAEIEWNDGSVDVIDDEYLNIESSLVGTNTVNVVDYPLEEMADGRALADVVIRTSNNEGQNEQRIPVENPAFGGDIPAIQAVDISSTRPGPNQWVSVQLRPRDDEGYQSLHSLDVYNPDGELVDVRRTGEEARFLTEGAGTYRLRANYDSKTGERFSKSIAIRAGETSLSTPPTIRMEQSVGGPFAVAGDGFANVEVEGDESNLELSGVLPGDAQAPGEIRLDPGDIQSGDDTSLSLAVLRGDSQTQVREHMRVVVNSPDHTDESIYYRFDGEPITAEGETRYGEIATSDENTRIQSYTDADGVISVSSNHAPGILDDVRHWVAVISPIETDFGILATTVDPLTSTASVGLTPAAGATMGVSP